MDFEDMLLDAMKQGKSLEDVMKGISAAANKIEKDRAAASKYDKFTKPVCDSFPNPSAASGAILHADKITSHDAAIVVAHFMCQNVPGYTKALAKNDTDPVDLYQKMLESQVRSAEVLTEHQDDSDEDKGKALFGHLLDEVLTSLMDKAIKSEDVGAAKSIFGDVAPCSLSASVRPGSPLFPTSDEQKMKDFLKRMGLD